MMSRILHAIALLLLFSQPLAAIEPDEMFDDPEKEARAREIGRQLRCLKCRNQSIFDSNAGLAYDLRVLVRERMEAGDTDQEVLDYIHARFGDYVLLKPPVTAGTYVLWLTPMVMVLLAAAGATAYLRRRPHPAAAPDLSDAEREEARRLLHGKENP